MFFFQIEFTSIDIKLKKKSMGFLAILQLIVFWRSLIEIQYKITTTFIGIKSKTLTAMFELSIHI